MLACYIGGLVVVFKLGYICFRIINWLSHVHSHHHQQWLSQWYWAGRRNLLEIVCMYNIIWGLGDDRRWKWCMLLIIIYPTLDDRHIWLILVTVVHTHFRPFEMVGWWYCCYDHHIIINWPSFFSCNVPTEYWGDLVTRLSY